jgi:hypothetical protein
MLTQELLIVVRAVLAAPVRVVDAAFWRSAQGDRHCQRLNRQILLQAVAGRPFCYTKGICAQITQGNDAPGM